MNLTILFLGPDDCPLIDWMRAQGEDVFATAAASLGMTDYVMRFFPVITLIVGLGGGVVFYTRKNSGFSSSGATDGFE